MLGFLLGDDVVENVVELHPHVHHAGKGGGGEDGVSNDGVHRIRVKGNVGMILQDQRDDGYERGLTTGNLGPQLAGLHRRPRRHVVGR